MIVEYITANKWYQFSIQSSKQVHNFNTNDVHYVEYMLMCIA